ncbi:F-box domain, Leucine-rich repeat domain, L domain-like protein [Artemisia annua]|uniref:F-box domain, Leucine-rich repeat domain, L domain-like protein n=1 Tax=Artemisia annua TaxID=35608 RepID=A0A2U1P9E5_ARTAN|nr:F-box domain, Leucine-rich repeat domain, L domain-like protein [Artemisia annua]
MVCGSYFGDKDDPEALFEGVAMVGLVGVLRQLGDLAHCGEGGWYCNGSSQGDEYNHAEDFIIVKITFEYSSQVNTGKRMDVEVDRLSSLPDKLIYKILSYVDIVYCVRLSVLSSRWRFLWTSMPSLNFASRELYKSSSRYHEFVNNVLSGRNNKIDVSFVSVNLARGEDNHELCVKRILEYALSHNIEQLTMSHTFIDCRSQYPWDLPALTTLHLHDVSLHNSSSIFAMYHSLKNLTLERCHVLECDSDGVICSSHGFTIINSRLLSLTLKKVRWIAGFVLVDTPELKNFILVDTPPGKEWEYYSRRGTNELLGGLTISARDLTYLSIKGFRFPKLSLDGIQYVEKVDLCISSPQKTNVHRIHDLFQHLHSVKSLALSLEIAELLSTSEEVVSHQPSPFPSLKSLKIYPLQGLKTWPLCSSNATFTMVSHEEARAIKITKAAHRLMADLWKILEEKEAYTETKRANVEWKKTLADSCRLDFKLKISLEIDTEEIFCILQNIKLLLTKVIASKRVEMQARFSRLSAKSKTVVNKMLLKDWYYVDRTRTVEYLQERW